MSSRPPTPSFTGIAVDDMLAVPEIQELLATDGSTEAQTETTNVGNPPGVFIPPTEELDIEKQLPGDLPLQQTTRSIPACIAPASATERARQPSQENEQQQEKPSADALSSEQQVQVMSAAELDKLCHKLQVKTATVGHDKHEKAAARQQKTQIRALQSELTRLHKLEADLKQYEQRSLSSLQDELQTRQREIAELSNKLQRAAQEELDWIDSMSSNLRK